MNPEQVEALIKDLKNRAAGHAAGGNEKGEYYYECAARIVREHADDAAAVVRRDKFASLIKGLPDSFEEAAERQSGRNIIHIERRATPCIADSVRVPL